MLYHSMMTGRAMELAHQRCLLQRIVRKLTGKTLDWLRHMLTLFPVAFSGGYGLETFGQHCAPRAEAKRRAVAARSQSI